MRTPAPAIHCDGRLMRLDIRRREEWARKVVTYLYRGYTITAACQAAGVSRKWWWTHRETFKDLKPRRKRDFSKAS